ncbi:hypothetical protein ACQKJC_18665 [Priestia koreensis]|uniref:hypothetical protein n=1 Tax=Priestia koreensis TaxID=284581 RepID=UPI003D00A6E0
MEEIMTNVLKDERLDDYPLFKKFCQLKEKGLRKESFSYLSSFINEETGWEDKKREHFARWLFGLFEGSDHIHHLLVYPLEENVLKPILNTWMKKDPKDSRPFRWYGLFLQTENRIEYLNKAIKLGGKSEQLALLKLINLHFDSLWFSFHHLSEDLYLGNVAEDLILIATLQLLNNNVECPQTRKTVETDINYYRELLNDWMAFESEQENDFVQWCKNRGKDYPWTTAYYYEK